MGKRYHCDYCGKSFPDNPQSKKNHMNGVYHQRNRKAHYDLFRGNIGTGVKLCNQCMVVRSCKYNLLRVV